VSPNGSYLNARYNAIRCDAMFTKQYRERIYRSWERSLCERAVPDETSERERERERERSRKDTTAIGLIRKKRDRKKRAMADGNAPTIDCKYTERATCALYTLVHRAERKEREEERRRVTRSRCTVFPYTYSARGKRERVNKTLLHTHTHTHTHSLSLSLRVCIPELKQTRHTSQRRARGESPYRQPGKDLGSFRLPFASDGVRRDSTREKIDYCTFMIPCKTFRFLKLASLRDININTQGLELVGLIARSGV